jgi:head-tail adaptor
MNENEHNLAKTRYQAPQSKPAMNNPTNTLRTSNTQMRALTERCPWCDSAISHSRFAEIEVKIRQQEQLKLAESSKQLRAQLEAEHATELTRQRQHNEQQLQTLLKAKLKEVDAEQQKLFADQRAAMEKDRDESAPGDRVIRVPKGQPGADIQVEVTHKGQPCGKIIAECKNTKAWQNSFIEKLRQDQMAAGAEHAVLATTVFPRGQKDIWVDSDVIVASPGRVTHIVAILRRSMVTIHLRGLSLNERASKMSRLYALITSDRHAQQFREVEKLSTDIANLDAQEKRSHETVWKKRVSLTTRIADALREIDSEVSDVIEGESQTELSVAS